MILPSSAPWPHSTPIQQPYQAYLGEPAGGQYYKSEVQGTRSATLHDMGHRERTNRNALRDSYASHDRGLVPLSAQRGKFPSMANNDVELSSFE